MQLNTLNPDLILKMFKWVFKTFIKTSIYKTHRTSTLTTRHMDTKGMFISHTGLQICMDSEIIVLSRNNIIISLQCLVKGIMEQVVPTTTIIQYLIIILLNNNLITTIIWEWVIIVLAETHFTWATTNSKNKAANSTINQWGEGIESMVGLWITMHKEQLILRYLLPKATTPMSRQVTS
jgi:hypothetical protein